MYVQKEWDFFFELTTDLSCSSDVKSLVLEKKISNPSR